MKEEEVKLKSGFCTALYWISCLIDIVDYERIKIKGSKSIALLPKRNRNKQT